MSKGYHRLAILGFVALLLLGLVGVVHRSELGSWIEGEVSKGSGFQGRVLLVGEQAAAPQGADSAVRFLETTLLCFTRL